MILQTFTYVAYLFTCWVIILLSAAFFLSFKINFLGSLSECQIDWIQIRTTTILLVLIWVQTVSKGYQQTTKVAASRQSYTFLKKKKNRFSWILLQLYTICLKMYNLTNTYISIMILAFFLYFISFCEIKTSHFIWIFLLCRIMHRFR